MTTIDDLRAELARERAAHAVTRQVLEDAVRDRGGVVVLSAAVCGRVMLGLTQATACCDGNYTESGRWHLASCDVAYARRIIGGPEETQRQVDAAHAEALAMRAVYDPWRRHRRGDNSPRDARTDNPEAK